MISSCLFWLGMLSKGEALCPWQRLHTCEGQHWDAPSSFKQYFMGNKNLFYVLFSSGLELIPPPPPALSEGMSKTRGTDGAEKRRTVCYGSCLGTEGQRVCASSATDLLLSKPASPHQLFFFFDPQHPWDTSCACITLPALATAG